MADRGDHVNASLRVGATGLDAAALGLMLIVASSVFFVVETEKYLERKTDKTMIGDLS